MASADTEAPLRWRVAAWAGPLCLLMGWYTWERGIAPSEGFAVCAHDPVSCHGVAFTLPLVTIRQVGPDSAVVAKGPLEVRLKGSVGESAIGDVVSVGGVFEVDGAVHVDWSVTHPRRRHKRWLGLLGVVLVSASMPMWLRWERGGLVVG